MATAAGREGGGADVRAGRDAMARGLRVHGDTLRRSAEAVAQRLDRTLRRSFVPNPMVPDAELSRVLARVSPRTQQAFQAVDRKLFMPPELRGQTYVDHRIPLAEGRSMPPVAAVAQMIEALALTGEERVLHIGTGSGYAAALLGRLAREVFTIEHVPRLAAEARDRLAALGVGNVTVSEGDGLLGCPARAPFDAILVSATGMEVPRGLLDQLAIGGRLVIPVGPFRAHQELYRVVRRDAEDFEEQHVGTLRMSPLLGDILVQIAEVAPAEIEEAAAVAQGSGRRLGEVLMQLGFVEERDLYRALARQRGLRFATVDELLPRFDPSLAQAVPRQFLIYNQLIPISRSDTTAEVATSNPNAAATELAQALDRSMVDVFLVSPTDYRRLWTIVDLGSMSGVAGDRGVWEAPALEEEGDLLAERGAGTEETRYVELFDALLLYAVGERASDIHFERFSNRVRIRLRVDGEMRDLHAFRLGMEEVVGVINVLKINANMDIAERRLPQGGRFRRRAGELVFDLRVQTQPSLHGECAVVRLLPQNAGLLQLEDLGLPEALVQQYRRLLFSPSGLLLVVGPTGSGKSTTIYAGLQVLAMDSTRKVITVEDPVEYAIDNIQQTQVKPAIGFDFASAIRSFLRQDPDAIIVGEIRDHETALEAIRASQTGHVVLSTLHSNDAVDAVQRLFDLDMHPNSVASELLAVLAQRLARRICTRCRQPAHPDPATLAEVFPRGVPADFRCFEGRGCERCKGHGTYGRVAVSEFLRANPMVRTAISRQLPVDELRRVCVEAGLVTMRDAALWLVQHGVIPLTEIPRILPAERMAPERASAAMPEGGASSLLTEPVL